MKYVLLIMTIMQIKTFWRSFKGIFKPSKNDTKQLNESIKGLEDILKNKSAVDGLMIIIATLYGLFLSLYYMFAGIKVGSLIYIILSCVMVIKSWKSVGMTIKWLSSRNDEIIKRRFVDRIWSIFYLSYIGYLVYFLVVNWL